MQRAWLAGSVSKLCDSRSQVTSSGPNWAWSLLLKKQISDVRDGPLFLLLTVRGRCKGVDRPSFSVLSEGVGRPEDGEGLDQPVCGLVRTHTTLNPSLLS